MAAGCWAAVAAAILDQSRDRLELLLDHRLQPLALAAPRAHKLIKRPARLAIMAR